MTRVLVAVMVVGLVGTMTLGNVAAARAQARAATQTAEPTVASMAVVDPVLTAAAAPSSDPTEPVLRVHPAARHDSPARQDAPAPAIAASRATTVSASVPTVRRITGMVTNAGGTPMSGEVRAYNADGLAAAWAPSSDDGTYSLVVVPGTYTIRFEEYGPPFPWGWYATSGFAALKADASPVVVGASDVSGIDIGLPTALHITGTVANAGGTPIECCLVRVHNADGFSAWAPTAEDGTYSLAVVAGRYTIRFEAFASPFPWGWYAKSGFAALQAGASPVVVSTSDVSGIDVRLPTARHITGTVTNAVGNPVDGISVRAYNGDGVSAFWTTAEDGTYSLPVVAGTYTIRFEHISDPWGWYATSGFAALQADASPVVVGASDVSGIDVSLPSAPAITGTVTNAGGTPIDGIEVRAYNADGLSGWGQTAADGSYVLAVVAGTYTIRFEDYGSTYPWGWYSTSGFAALRAGASPVVVGAADASGIDVSLPTAPTAAITPLPTWRASTAIHLAWSAAEGSAAVINYDVRYRRAAWNGGFGSYVLWRRARTGTSATFSASAGATYCFSVRARDALGAVSAWTSQRCTAIPLDDRSLSRVGSWSAGTGSAYYKGTYLRSTRSGAKLVRTGVVARQIALVVTTCPTCGTVKVYWGSTLLRTIKLTSTTTVNRKLIAVTTFTSVRKGTLTIKVSSTGRKVIIDGVAIRRN